MSTLRGSRQREYMVDTDSILTDPSSAKLTADIQKTHTLEKSLKVVHQLDNDGKKANYGEIVTVKTNPGNHANLERATPTTMTTFTAPQSPTGGRSNSVTYSRTGSLSQSEIFPVYLRQNVNQRGVIESNRETHYTTLPLGQTLTIETDVEDEDHVDSKRNLVGKETRERIRSDTHQSENTGGRLYSVGSEETRESHIGSERGATSLTEAIIRKKQEEHMRSRVRTL